MPKMINAGSGKKKLINYIKITSNYRMVTMNFQNNVRIGLSKIDI
jgi:hypothetical protein